jgi:hypothetical protein
MIARGGVDSPCYDECPAAAAAAAAATALATIIGPPSWGRCVTHVH